MSGVFRPRRVSPQRRRVLIGGVAPALTTTATVSTGLAVDATVDVRNILTHFAAMIGAS